MELNFYDIIKKPIITSRSVELFRKLGKVTFEVHKDANKISIKQAVENIWAVKVANVCIVNTPEKSKLFARKVFVTPGKKKAIVTLKKGYKIEIPGMLESIGSTESLGSSENSK